MQITHEEAHRLIHGKADHGLSTTIEEKLSAHLRTCTECRSYFNSIQETETILRQTLQKQWNARRPLPLQMEVLYEKVSREGNINVFVTTRTALIGVAFIMFAIITWQSMATVGITSQQSPFGTVPLIPTPLTQFTVTNTLQNDCDAIKYHIQEGDTLESIAHHFSVPMEAIMLANNLTGELPVSTRELIIPVCSSTPTSTSHPPTFTITPIFEAIATTPG